MFKKKIYRATLMTLAIAVGTLGCGDGEALDEADSALAELRKKREAARKKPKKVVAEKEQAAAGSLSEDDLNFSYNSSERRDPFKTYFDELQVIDPQKNTTELQRHELDKLKLIAVVVGTASPMAMVEDPSGRGHTVRIGTLIGKRFGQVKKIRRGEIMVEEEIRQYDGKRIPDQKILKLIEDAGLE